MNSYDHYKNMRDSDAHQFDEQWQNMANQLGFSSSTVNNRLGYGDHGLYNNNGRYVNENRGLGYSDDMRGHYIPT